MKINKGHKKTGEKGSQLILTYTDLYQHELSLTYTDLYQHELSLTYTDLYQHELSLTYTDLYQHELSLTYTDLYQHELSLTYTDLYQHELSLTCTDLYQHELSLTYTDLYQHELSLTYTDLYQHELSLSQAVNVTQSTLSLLHGRYVTGSPTVLSSAATFRHHSTDSKTSVSPSAFFPCRLEVGKRWRWYVKNGSGSEPGKMACKPTMETKTS
ncbi:hypothetical protein ACOMHN_037132 [Nucella lapillus]